SISGGPLLGLQGPEILNHHVGHRVTTSNLITAVAIRETDAGARFHARLLRAGLAPPAARKHREERGPLGHPERDARPPEQRDASGDRPREPEELPREGGPRRPERERPPAPEAGRQAGGERSERAHEERPATERSEPPARPPEPR